MGVCNLTVDDIADVMHMGAEMHAESPNYRKLPFDPIKVGAWAAMHIRETNMCAFGARSAQGELIAVIFGSINPTYFGEALVATEDALYVDPAFRGSRAAIRIVRAYLRWAEEQGAARAVITPSTGINEAPACSFLSKLGLSKRSVSMAVDFG